MSNFFPRSVEELIAWFKNFVTVAGNNLAALNYTIADIEAMNALLSALETAQTNVIATKAAAKQAVELKDTNKTRVVQDIRSRAKIIQADYKIPNNIREALGLPVYDTIPSHEVPYQITNLTVEGFDFGSNKLNWDKNGNKPGTQYIIEAQYGVDGAFQVIDTVTATRYDHKGQTPGVAVYYRITPRRGKLLGDPSSTVGVYT